MKKTLFSMALLPLFAGAAMSEDLNYTVNNDTDTKGSIFVEENFPQTNRLRIKR